MGVTEGLPPGVLPQPEQGSWFSRLRGVIGLSRIAARLARKHIGHSRRVAAFHKQLKRALKPVPLANYGVEQLIDYYDGLQAEVIPAWETPLLNDLYCMICHGLLRKLCVAWLPPELAEAHNELVAGEAGIISLEPVRRMKEMANLVVDEEFAALLRTGSLQDVERAMQGQPAFERVYRTYLTAFGDRCIDELKLESIVLAEDPLPLLRAVGDLYAVTKHSGGDLGASDSAENSRELLEGTVSAAFKGRPFRRLVFALALKSARDRIRDRENLRFERTRVYGRVRAVFLRIGEQLVDAGCIAERDDVFYLDVREISEFIRGTAPSAALGEVARARREEFDGYRRAEGPPRRFVTEGPPHLPASRRVIDVPSATEQGDSRTGQACSPGVVRGRVRVVRDPRAADIEYGDILVAERTDPGWVTIFPRVSGMVMERGSLLSHSAIVARELKLPCIVGVADACEWLVDGDWVEIDGATGTVRRVARHERAA